MKTYNIRNRITYRIGKPSDWWLSTPPTWCHCHHIFNTPQKCLEGAILPPKTLPVAIDIEALYSSKPHSTGIKIISQFLREKGNDSWRYNQFIHTMLEHILTRDVFIFDGSHYFQVRGWLWAHAVPPPMPTCTWGGKSSPYLRMIHFGTLYWQCHPILGRQRGKAYGVHDGLW